MTARQGRAKKGAPERGPLSSVLLAEDEVLRASFEANSEKRSLALALKALRRWAGLRQADVAARSGLSQSHVSKMEAATGPMPTTETLHKYAAACGAQMRIDFLTRPRAVETGRRPDEGIIAAAMM